MAEFLRAALIACAVALPFTILGPALAATAPIVQTGSDWAHLTPTQREVLAPFAKEWNTFSEVAKLKWMGIADRYPKMTPPEQANVRARMQEWSKLTPQERQNAREQYKKLRTAPPEERKQLEQKWREYDALPTEQKQALKAAPKTPPPASASAPSALPGVRPPKPVVVAPRTVKPGRKPATPTSQPAVTPSLQSAPTSQPDPAKATPTS
ncbi:DUF3106 domain-containing protein [Uliginosibacterium sp. H3]|uniref:DUF3106 domain-containing protein n=1 Tax=Uliginosibacterium silvisoli TaxID=3114758 RepID=A0ABU6K4H8_9RHOO|nr:DUF3106 domain-containing protein [Uliginosibacterium sp. H3]